MCLFHVPLGAPNAKNSKVAGNNLCFSSWNWMGWGFQSYDGKMEELIFFHNIAVIYKASMERGVSYPLYLYWLKTEPSVQEGIQKNMQNIIPEDLWNMLNIWFFSLQ